MAPQAFLGVTIEVDMASMKKNLMSRMDAKRATPAQKADSMMVLRETVRDKYPAKNRKQIRALIHGK
jgi:hypothetical protein